MDNFVTKLEAIPLSGDDLLEQASKLGKDESHMSWIVYNDLMGVNSLEELFSGGLNSIFVLLQITNSSGGMADVGHWILLSIDDQRNLSYFDPYGLSIDQDLALTMEPRTILDLIGSMKVDVNRFRHQMFRDSVNTCGRHTVLRALFNFMSNKEYNDIIIHPVVQKKLVRNADVMANLITGFLSMSDDVVRKFFRGKSDRPEMAFSNRELVPSASNTGLVRNGFSEPFVQMGGVLLN